MTSITCLGAALQTLFTTTAERLAQETNFVRRRRRLTGSVFAVTLVFGFLDRAGATLRRGGLRLSDQGFFAIPVFRAVMAAGAHFLTRPVPRLTLRAGDGARMSLGTFLAASRSGVVDVPVVVGSKQTLACRLIAVRS